MEAIVSAKAAIFPKIESAAKPKLLKAIESNQGCIIVAREKIDGSNFTIFNDGEVLHFYNKNKELKGPKLQQSVFEYTVDALQTRKDIFKPGYTYHCEAMRKRRASHIKYEKIPRYHMVCYEIEKPDGFTATQEEMQEILKDTGIQIVHKLWDNRTDTLDQLLTLVDNVDNIPSMLGGTAEGFVVSILNRENKGKITTYHLKFVAKHMRERQDLNPNIFIGAIDDAMLVAIGDMYNVNPRFNKAVTRLEDQGVEVNLKTACEDLDRDLEEEQKKEIMEMLWKRCWPTIKKASRVGLHGYLKTHGYIKSDVEEPKPEREIIDEDLE